MSPSEARAPGTPRPEPTAAGFASGAASRLRRRLLATRPAFFPASVAPVIIGSAWGYRTAGHFDWTVFILALLATLLVHLACNVLNDVGDELTGADRQNEDRIFPYTGGSRFIQNGIMSTAEMTTWGLTLLGLAALPGIALLELRGPMILGFGAVGVLLGVLYSLPRIQLSAHGLGEAAIAIAFGVLPVNGAAWLQSGRIDGASLLISLPVGMWVAAILLMNEVPDRLADARAGKRTLAVRLGMQGTRALYLTLHALACAALLSAGALALVPWWMALLGLTLLPGAWAAAGAVREGTDRARLERGIEATLRLHTAGSILVVLCVMVAAFR